MASSKKPRKKPGILATLRQGSKPLRAGARPSGTGPRGKGGRRKAVAASTNGAAPAGSNVGQPELLRQREALAKRFAELQWDLGGMAYEMAARDHYRLDVLNKQAAKLQEVDAELGQVERLLKLGEAGAAGNCPSCGALQARGAVFCWQCGNELKPEKKTTAKPTAKSAPKTKR
jgi:hypothetical protein